MAEIAGGAARGKRIEIWFQDEARIGQKNKITRRWAKRGTRPSAPRDQRTRSAYLFGAICPEQGKGAGLVLPWCNTAAMDLHLAERSRTVASNAHAVLLMDQAKKSEQLHIRSMLISNIYVDGASTLTRSGNLDRKIGWRACWLKFV